eukprot:9516746-Heterocapsa_arctica.AAC.1
MLALSENLVREGWQVHFFAALPGKAQVEGTGATFCNYGSDDWDMFDAMKRVVGRLDVEPDMECSKRMMSYAA